MKKIAIITVNYNGAEDTIEFLESVKLLQLFEPERKGQVPQSRRPTNYQLLTIVVDNGSHDDSVKKILAKFPDIDLLQTGFNKGFAGGYNRGIEHALIWGAEYILIINNDTLIDDPHLLQKLAKTLDNNPKAAIVAPKIYFASGFEYHKNRYSKEESGKVIWYGGGEFDWNNVYSVHHGMNEVDGGKYDQEKEVSFATACCWMIKREALEKVGTFDEELFAYYEDNDLCMRFKNNGYKLFYNGQTSLFHKVSQTSGIGSSFGDYLMTRNRLYFGMKYASGRTKFALWREATKFLLIGRTAQKNAVLDYLRGKKGSEKEQKTPNPGYQIKLSVVTLNYNTPDLIDNLLKSIYREISIHKIPPNVIASGSEAISIKEMRIASSTTSPRNEQALTPFGRNDGNRLAHSARNDIAIEVIVLDNGSDLGCADVVKKYPEVKFIQNEVNTGFTGGNNTCYRFSRGEYILMLNSDIECTENSLANQLEAAEKYHGNAITSGALFFPDGTLQDSIFYLPTIWGAIKEYFLRIKGSFFMYAGPQDKDTRVEAAAMACFMIPRKILNKVGFLNEELFTYFEDVDFCRRCKKLGIPIYYTPSAKFIHHHGATGKTMKEGRAYQMLVRASKIYHGEFYYKMLYVTLLLAQKFSRTNTPVAR